MFNIHALEIICNEINKCICMKYVSLQVINCQHVPITFCHHHQGSTKRVREVHRLKYSMRHKRQTGKSTTRIQEHQKTTTQNHSSHMVQQKLQGTTTNTQIYIHQNQGEQQTKHQHPEGSNTLPNKPRNQIPVHQEEQAERTTICKTS